MVAARLRFAYFKGKVIRLTPEQFSARPSSEYLILIRAGVYLDCEEAALAGECKASLANCFKGLVHKDNPNVKAKANCILQAYPPGSDHLWLVSTQVADADDEVLWDYGNDFELP